MWGKMVEYPMAVSLSIDFYKKLLKSELNLPDNNETVNNLPYVFIGDEAFSLHENFLKLFSKKI